MKSLKENNGFSAVEALLIVVVLGIVSFTGYFVYHSKQATDKTLANTGNSTLPTSKKSTPTASQKALATVQTPAVSDNGYLTIKEWGIKIKMQNAEDVSVAVNNTPNNGSDDYDGKFDGSAAPSFKSGVMQDASCEPGVNLFRALKEDTDYKGTKVGNYYYWVTGGPGSCNSNADNQIKIQFLHDFMPANIQAL